MSSRAEKSQIAFFHVSSLELRLEMSLVDQTCPGYCLTDTPHIQLRTIPLKILRKERTGKFCWHPPICLFFSFSVYVGQLWRKDFWTRELCTEWGSGGVPMLGHTLEVDVPFWHISDWHGMSAYHNIVQFILGLKKKSRNIFFHV